MKIVFCCTGAKLQRWQEAFGRHLPEAEFAEWSPGSALADYAVLWHPPAQFFAEQVRLKAGFNIGAGVDGILKQGALPPHLPIIRLEDAGMADQMLDYVLYAVLHYFRGMDVYAEQQALRVWQAKRFADSPADFTVGVLGLGEIGRVVAQGLAARGFCVHGWSRTEKPLAGIHTHAGWDALPGLLALLDTLVLILPSTDETRGLMGPQRLRQLKAGAAIINVGRGDLLPAASLLDALDSGHVRGAFLDVLETEPLPPESALWLHPKIRLTPHVSARTLIDQSVVQMASKIRLLELGKPVSGVVDRNRGY
jgi:glyoxylate/hydroxypyruvate reductase